MRLTGTNGKFAIEDLRKLKRKLGRRILLRGRENGEPALSSPLADHGVEGFDLSWVDEPSSSGGVVSFESISSILNPHEVGDCKKSPSSAEQLETETWTTFFLLSTTLSSGLLSENREEDSGVGSSDVSGAARTSTSDEDSAFWKTNRMFGVQSTCGCTPYPDSCDETD